MSSTTSPHALSLFSADLQGTVYVSKSRSKGRPAIYRFSLNASIPAPWQMVSPGDGEVPSFQVSQSRDGGPLYQECSTQVSTRASCHSTGPWVAQGEGGCSKGASTDGLARGPCTAPVLVCCSCSVIVSNESRSVGVCGDQMSSGIIS